jgi:hypothetical protein
VSESSFRAVLYLLAAYHLATGALALFAPDTFFDEIGRYGIENSHYVGDAGSFQFAIGIAFVIAALRADWRAPILGLGALWYGVHALNHLFDIDEARSDARGAIDTALLALGGLGLAWLSRLASRSQPAP